MIISDTFSDINEFISTKSIEDCFGSHDFTIKTGYCDMILSVTLLIILITGRKVTNYNILTCSICVLCKQRKLRPQPLPARGPRISSIRLPGWEGRRSHSLAS